MALLALMKSLIIEDLYLLSKCPQVTMVQMSSQERRTIIYVGAILATDSKVQLRWFLNLATKL
jgi:hypothetical protein